MTSEPGAASPAAQPALTDWLAGFARAVADRDLAAVQSAFVEDGYWKDILAFTWEHRTFAGPEAIAAAFAATGDWAGIRDPGVAAARAEPRRLRRAGRWVIEAYFDFDTRFGIGTAFVRLVESEAGPRIWLLLTTLNTLHGSEERIGPRRPTGDQYSQNTSPNNWADDRRRAREAAETEPEVLIVGAGHAGLMLAARLGQMGVRTLVIEQTPRIGDVWRNRYHSLTLHNEVTANHLPYLQFPETWPVWLPKDMMAAWLESYAVHLELNVMTETELVHADYDPASATWSARLRCRGAERVISCRQLVAATGVSGSVPYAPQLPGIEDFAGTLMHSDAFVRGSDHVGQRAIVVGAGNSGHDVAQDLVVHGAASVHMLQRGPTCVVSLVPSAKMVYAIYDEGRPVDDVDLITAAVPYPLLVETYQFLAQKSEKLDADLLGRLHAAGFETYQGEDGTGFHMMYLRGRGGYYIDVGCSELIASGRVGVLNYRTMDRFVRDGLRLRDGRVVPCDLVVLATGFHNMQENVRRMLGDEVADRIGPVWGFGENYTLRNMWTRTAQPGFWITGGALIDSRLFSRFLAIEIKAALDSILPARADLPLAQHPEVRSLQLAA